MSLLLLLRSSTLSGSLTELRERTTGRRPDVTLTGRRPDNTTTGRRRSSMP